MTLQVRILLVILAVTSLSSCRKPNGANWDVDMVIPVANGRLNISNFIADTIFKADNSGLLHFIFNREIASVQLDSIIRIADTLYKPDPFVAPTNISLNPGQTITFFAPSELKFSIPNGIEITYADIRSARLQVKFSNSASQPLDLIYKIPSATKDGQPFVIQETVPPGGNTLTKTYKLDGYRLSMRGENGNKYNTIVQSYTIGLNASASPVTIQAGQGVSIELEYSDITPEYIEGFFGTDKIDIPADTVSFSFLNNIKAGNFMLSETRMEFRIQNEFGADFEASLDGIRSINMQTGNTVSLSPNKLSLVHLDWPTRNWQTVTPSTKSILFDQSNSNITAFISNLPDRLAYSGKVQINPLVKTHGNYIGHSNYAFYGKGIRIAADIDIPMKFTADYLHVESVAKVDFSNIEQLDNVNGGQFVIAATNGYPFTVLLQAYMLDEFGSVMDSLLVPGANHIQGGATDASNKVIAPAVSRVNVPLDKEKIDRLRKCRSVMIVSHFVMPPNPPDIQIFEHYEFEVKITAEVNYRAGMQD
jgi:hypothetical protein